MRINQEQIFTPSDHELTQMDILKTLKTTFLFMGIRQVVLSSAVYHLREPEEEVDLKFL